MRSPQLALGAPWPAPGVPFFFNTFINTSYYTSTHPHNNGPTSTHIRVCASRITWFYALFYLCAFTFPFWLWKTSSLQCARTHIRFNAHLRTYTRVQCTYILCIKVFMQLIPFGVERICSLSALSSGYFLGIVHISQTHFESLESGSLFLHLTSIHIIFSH